MENEKNYYTQPDENQQNGQGEQQFGGQSYGQGEQQFGGQSYGQTGQQTENQQNGQGEQQFGGQSYGQGEQQFGGQGYGQQTENQSYGQSGQQFGGQSYGQQGQQFGGQSYGQGEQQFGWNPNMGYGAGMPAGGQYGQPLENRFGMKLTFSILEILSCNLITIIMGIIGCIFTTKANTSYKEGRWEDFKSEAKTSAICLWIGLGAFIIVTILGTLIWALDKGTNSIGSHTGGSEIYVKVDGTRIDIPLSYDEMEELGFSLDHYDAGSTLEGNGDFGLYQLTNEYGDYVMWAWFANDSNHEARLEDCDIIGIDVDCYCDNYEIYETSEGLGFFDSAEDFIDAYGTPDDREYDMFGEKLSWYLGNGDDPVWKVMEVTFDGDELYDIDVDYWK